jgi:hypothetical protein
MNTNFGNKEGEDNTLPLDTITTRADGQMKEYQQIINHKIFGVHYIPPSGRYRNVIAYFLFTQ